MREKGQTEVAKTLETPVFSRGIEILTEKFEFYSYGHALEILHEAFPVEWAEVQNCLRSLSLSVEDIKKDGGNESPIPKKFDAILYPCG